MARQEGFEPPTLWFVAGYENAHKPHYKRKLKLICIHFAYISVNLLFEELVKVLHFLSLILVIEMKALGQDLRAKKIIYNNNPIDLWCFSNTAVEEDRNGNIEPTKTSRSTRRIDGTAALLDAYVVLSDKMEEYQSMI